MSSHSHKRASRAGANSKALTRALRAFAQMLPIVLGMLLLTSLLITWLPSVNLPTWLGRWSYLDVLLAAVAGSIAVGHPVAGYILAGGLLADGVSLVAVTALLVSWVSVGIVQLPAEALVLGRRFALTRNLFCFLSAVIVSYLVAGILRLLG